MPWFHSDLGRLVAALRQAMTPEAALSGYCIAMVCMRIHSCALECPSSEHSGMLWWCRSGSKVVVQTYLVWREGEIERSPGVLNLAQGLLNDKLLLCTVDNLAASIHVVVQLKLEEVSQIELVVHHEILACGLHT